MKKVLILEDEANIRSFVVINLQRAGYEVVEAATGDEALDRLQQDTDIGVAVLDITVPGIDVFEICRWIRDTGRPVGVMMLTVPTQEMDKVTGLMTGVDAYLEKPFSPAELTAWVGELFDRLEQAAAARSVLTYGRFSMNTSFHTLDKNDEHIRLTQPEYGIMELFLRNPGRVLTREEIFRQVWGGVHERGVSIVDVNIRRLRLKIEDNAAAPKYITTVSGCGYKWGN